VEEEAKGLTRLERFYDLPAVKNSRVYATNGSDYFSRPGPRIVDSLEILAHLVHPEMFAPPPISDAFATVDLTTNVVR
jgi:iron complex transport system substrate-binding protein